MPRINLAQDPSLRSGTTNAYSALNGATLSYSPEYGFYGTGSLKVVRTSQNNAGVRLAPVPVVAGLKYAFSAYARIPVTIPEAEHAEQIIEVSWTNSIGAVIKTDQTTTLEVDSDTTWYRIGGVWTAPAGATVATMRVFQPLAGSAESIVYLDAFLIEQSSHIGGYFDELTTGKKMEIVNRGLSAVPQVINGVRLGADVILNDLVLNTIDEDDTIWVVTDIQGWWGQTSPELPDIPRGTEDGSYDVQGRLTSRTITISGFFIPKDAETYLSKSIDRLVTAANIVRKGGWFVANENPNKAAWVRLGNKPTINTVNARGKTEFEITVRSGDPIKYHWNDSDPDGYTTSSYRSSDIIDEFYTNVFSNPSFEASGPSVEVRRNYNSNPRVISSITGWNTTGAAATLTATASGGQIDVTTGPTGVPLFFNSSDIATSVGDYWSASMEVSVPAGFPAASVDLRVYSYGQSLSVAQSGTVTIQPGTTVTLKTASISAVGSPATSVRAILYGAATPTGARLVVKNALLEKTAIPGTYFDGTSIGVDPDMTASWVGTANASESILSGVSAPGVVPFGAVAIRSGVWKKDGAYSARIIPNTASTNSGFSIGSGSLPLTATHIVYTYLAAPVQNPSSNAGLVSRYSPQTGVQRPNTVGEYEHRFESTTNAGTLDVRVGCKAGDGEMWVDLVTVVAGSYSGPSFSGSSPGTLGVQHAWTGAADASTSTRTVRNEDVLTNIGTAEVSGIFTITGPVGVGTRIYNATTDESMVLAQPLRGAGVIAAANYVEAVDGLATVYTEAPNQLRAGDEIALLNMVIPFSESNQTRIVTAVSEVFPYSFSFAIATDDIDKMSTNGQVLLVNDDVLLIDTYNRSVTYNGEIAGHRSRLTTLTDWVHFAPGKNVIEYFDDVTEVDVIKKELVGNEVTLTTEGIHYITPGESLTVKLPVDVPLSKKSLTSNKVTLTTAVPHGYSVGDTVNIESTETSNVVTKSRTSNVVTLTTEVPHGISATDNIVVALSETTAASRKSLTSNVATITTQNPHGYSVGDSVTVALPVNATVSSKSLTANQATLTTSAAHNFSVGDSITVSMPTTATLVGKARSGSQVIITTSAAHGYSVNDQITVSLPVSATPTGNLSANGTTNLVTVTTTAAHGFMVGDRITIAGSSVGSFNGDKVVESTPTGTTFTFRDWSLTANSTPASTGMTIVNTTNQSYNGTKTIISSSGTTFAYNL